MTDEQRYRLRECSSRLTALKGDVQAIRSDIGRIETEIAQLLVDDKPWSSKPSRRPRWWKS